MKRKYGNIGARTQCEITNTSFFLSFSPVFLAFSPMRLKNGAKIGAKTADLLQYFVLLFLFVLFQKHK